jgi:hypothetical protein
MSCRFLHVRLWIWAAIAAVFAGCWLLVSPIELAVAVVTGSVFVAFVRIAFSVSDSIGTAWDKVVSKNSLRDDRNQTAQS